MAGIASRIAIGHPPAEELPRTAKRATDAAVAVGTVDPRSRRWAESDTLEPVEAAKVAD